VINAFMYATLRFAPLRDFSAMTRDIAAIAVLVASNQSCMITGTTIAADGGCSA
jgi:hypothetical protein